MSAQRPTVSARLIAAVIESTPDRVRRRLDRDPNAADSWQWQAIGKTWSVDTGGETVTLPLGHVFSLEQLRCTCLLSPSCFHVLACLTRLQVAISEVEGDEAALAAEMKEVDAEADGDSVEPSATQRHAASELARSLAQMLRVGVANAGVVVQSSLLRAVHECRAEGLHRLAALGLGVIAGTTQFRSRAPESDPGQLANDVADVLETSRQVLSGNAIASFWIGTARRRQVPVRPRKLHGLLAEPIITRSGHAGAAAYFLGEDGRIYTASDVRPGDAQHARNAYLGGIEFGPMFQPAKQLARGLYLGSDLTASQDGRLGRGKHIKIVEQGQSTWAVEPIRELFRRPLAQQWNSIYAMAGLPEGARSAGWDLSFLEGAVIGAAGPDLLLQLSAEGYPVRLAIAHESDALCFRENLRMLSYAPGLRLQVVARVVLQEPTVVYPLAIAQMEDEARLENEPRLEVSKGLGGRIFLGFDEIQRQHLAKASDSPVVLNTQTDSPDHGDPLESLERRWIATVLSGSVLLHQGIRKSLARETALLSRNGFATGAALLHSLSQAAVQGLSSNMDIFLATGTYLRKCRHELAKARAMLVIGS